MDLNQVTYTNVIDLIKKNMLNLKKNVEHWEHHSPGKQA